MKPTLSIVKIGGALLEDQNSLVAFLKAFANIPGAKILVHGGGKKASSILAKMGIEPKMVNGRRVTDQASLEVVTMVYAGLTNKNVVAQLQSLGTNAIGMSGADANSIKAHKRPIKEIDFGFAGDIDSVDATMVSGLLSIGLTPVFCALTHDTKGQLLNTNADTIAAELAISLCEQFSTTLNYCFELEGVLEDIQNPSSLLKEINQELYLRLKAAGKIADGMLPKLHNCFDALQRGVDSVRIGNLGLFDTSSNQFTQLSL